MAFPELKRAPAVNIVVASRVGRGELSYSGLQLDNIRVAVVLRRRVGCEFIPGQESEYSDQSIE